MKPKGRPRKHRAINGRPVVIQFSPRGKPGRPDEVELQADEFEALRLADFLRKSQSEAASSMKISQQTFSRIITCARKAVSKALVMGKIIKIRAVKQLTLGWHSETAHGITDKNRSNKTVSEKRRKARDA